VGSQSGDMMSGRFVCYVWVSDLSAFGRENGWRRTTAHGGTSVEVKSAIQEEVNVIQMMKTKRSVFIMATSRIYVRCARGKLL
jgi:hypothetical protein